MTIDSFILNVLSETTPTSTDERILNKHEEVLKLAFPAIPVVRDAYADCTGRNILFLHVAGAMTVDEGRILKTPPIRSLKARQRKSVILSGLDPELANIHEAHGLGGAIVFQRTGVMMAYRPDIVDDRDQGEELLHVFGNEESAAHWFRIYFLLLGRHVFETE